MIQRVQTIFLAFVLIVVGVLFYIPVYNLWKASNDVFVPRLLQQLKILSLSIAIIPLIALIAIFMFRNRKRQLRVVNTGMFLSLVLFVLCIAFPNLFSSSYLITDKKVVVEYGIGIYLIGLIPVLFFLAGRFIKKDENLVKAADRLR